MKYIILIIISVNYLFPFEYSFHPFLSNLHFNNSNGIKNFAPYLSPGIKIVYDFKFGLRFEHEFSFGIHTMVTEKYYPVHTSITFGKIKYYKSSEIIKYQMISVGSILGISAGKLTDNRKIIGNKYSLYLAFIGPFITFDKLSFFNKKASHSINILMKHPFIITTNTNDHLITP